MEALLAAWSCANTEHGTGTKKPVPNADGWSINWKERDVNGRPKRDRYLRAPDNTIFRSVAGLQRFFGGHADAQAGDALADADAVAEVDVVNTPTGDNRANVAKRQKLIVCWETMPDGGLQVLLHGVEPKGALQWFPAKVEVAGLGRAGYTLLYPVDEETFERQTLNGEGRIVYKLVEEAAFDTAVQEAVAIARRLAEGGDENDAEAEAEPQKKRVKREPVGPKAPASEPRCGQLFEHEGGCHGCIRECHHDGPHHLEGRHGETKEALRLEEYPRRKMPSRRGRPTAPQQAEAEAAAPAVEAPVMGVAVMGVPAVAPAPVMGVPPPAPVMGVPPRPLLRLKAKVEMIKNSIGDDSFCSTSISGILKEANALMGLETEGTLPDQAAKLSAELGI
jgi:hypothetical protein